MIGLVFATAQEATPSVDQYAEGRLDGLEDGQHVEMDGLLLTVTGSGKMKATLHTERLLQQHDLDLLLHLGGATALAEDLEVGTLAGITFVLEGDRVELETPTYPRMPLDLPFDLPTEGTLVTQDHTSEDSAEQSYWERIADLRDTTGYAVAYVAAQHGVPCYIVKGITAVPEEEPSANKQQEVYEALAAFLQANLDTLQKERLQE